jgi:hypothetical protein
LSVIAYYATHMAGVIFEVTIIYSGLNCLHGLAP